MKKIFLAIAAVLMAGSMFAEWDGTVTLSKTTFSSIADLEGLVLTFPGADIVSSTEFGTIALQNRDGSEVYAYWSQDEGGQFSVNINVITLTDWTDNTSENPLPTVSGPIYIKDHGAFSADSREQLFKTVGAQYVAPAQPEVKTLAIDPTELKVGETVEFIVVTDHFTDEPTIAYYVKLGEGAYTQISGDTYTPTEAGTYTVKVTATYGTESAVKEGTFTVYGLSFNTMSVAIKDSTATDTLNIRLAASPVFEVSEDGKTVTAYKGEKLVRSLATKNLAKLFYANIDHIHALTLAAAEVSATDEATGHKAYWECTGSAEDSACHKYFADSLGTKLIGDSAALAAWLTTGEGLLPIHYVDSANYFVVTYKNASADTTLIIKPIRVSEMSNATVGTGEEAEDYFKLIYRDAAKEALQVKAEDLKAVEVKKGSDLNPKNK